MAWPTRLRTHGSAAHGRYGAVSDVAPSELYSNSTVALDVETGKLVWYFQELPGDDWDADHNQERILVRTRVSPDPRFVKWINPALTPGTEQDVVITVAEGGGMFAVARETGQFLWARPFPFDDPNLNMSVVDVMTGQTGVNPDKLFKEGRRHHSWAATTTRAACGRLPIIPARTPSTSRSTTSA